MKRISTQAVNKAFELDMVDSDGYYSVGWNQLKGRKRIAQAQFESDKGWIKSHKKIVYGGSAIVGYFIPEVEVEEK